MIFLKEKDEVMKNLSSANRQNEVERQRQAELIAQRREKRLQQKKTTEEKALELLEKAVAMDKMYLQMSLAMSNSQKNNNIYSIIFSVFFIPVKYTFQPIAPILSEGYRI